jgi:hypothetical protein
VDRLATRSLTSFLWRTPTIPPTGAIKHRIVARRVRSIVIGRAMPAPASGVACERYPAWSASTAYAGGEGRASHSIPLGDGAVHSLTVRKGCPTPTFKLTHCRPHGCVANGWASL